MFLTDEQIEEELRQLREIPDGDEEIEHADTQYSDYPYPENAPLTLPAWMNSEAAIYWINRTQEIFPGQDIKIQVGE
jgi:hypothetical protein